VPTDFLPPGGGGSGAAGPPGPTGPAGATGAQGPKGDPGTPGATGATGPAGATGAQGPKGDTGAQGPAGTLPTPPWIAPTFQNSWRAFAAGWSTPGYRKIGDIVYLRGMVTGGTSPSTAFTLPAGYIPPNNIVAVVLGDNPTTANGRVDINAPSGNVVIQSGPSSSAGFVSLDGVQFSVTP
jgi:hypothetical protein